MPVPSLRADCEYIVNRISSGDPEAEELLSSMFSTGLRFLAQRYAGDAWEQCVEETIRTAICHIKEGKLANAADLPAYMRTLLKGRSENNREARVRKGSPQALDYATAMAPGSRRPEQNALLGQRVRLLVEALRKASTREREVLNRLYLQGQSTEEIQQAMNITGAEVHLIKARAKHKFERTVVSRGKKLAFPTLGAFSPARAS